MPIVSRQDGNAGHQFKLDNTNDVPRVSKIGTDFSKKMVEGRLARGWTRKQLAVQSNLTESVITAYETGKAVKNSEEMNKIMKAFAKKKI